MLRWRHRLRWLQPFSPTRDGLLVLSQPQERRVADSAVVGPVGEAYLADQKGLGPVMAAAGRDRAGLEWRRGAHERLESLPDRLERGLVETGSDLRHVDETGHGFRAVVEPQVQRAEVAARALRIGVAADHELLSQVALDLDPVAAARAGVEAARALGHDALEALLRGGLVEGLARAHHVVAIAGRAEGRYEQP